MRDFLIKITNIDDKEIGKLSVPGMGADNDFVDIISYAYHNIAYCKYKNFPKRKLEDATFTVSVYKIDTRGHRRLVNSMDVDLPEDSSFDEVLDLAYHGCTDN